MFCFFGIQYKQAQTFKNDINVSFNEKVKLENKTKSQESEINFKSQLLNTITSSNTSVKVFWNTKDNKVIIDVSSLPEAPSGMVYQVWSLKLNPLTPKSLGLLDGYTKEKSLFLLNNDNNSEGFGITLEPKGGSESPTLEELYVLGTTNA